MYSESLTHNFVYEGEAAERLLKAIEESIEANKKENKKEVTVQYEELYTMEEIRNFMKKRNINKGNINKGKKEQSV